MANLQELLAFHDEILGLHKAGSTVNLGLPHNPAAIESQLRLAALELGNTSRGGSESQDADSRQVDDAYLTDDALPASYRHALAAGIRVERLPAAFEGISRAAQISRHLRSGFKGAAAYLLFIVIVAFLLLGSILARSLFHIESVYRTMDLATPDTADFGMGMGRIGVGWFIAPFVVGLLVLLYVWISRTWYRKEGFLPLMRWMPGFRGFDRDVRMALFAETLAQLRMRGIPRTEAMALSSATSDCDIDAGTIASQSSRHVPPMLRWAVTSTHQDQDRESKSLQLVARLYREQAFEKAERLSKLMPILATVAVGICIVLIYALVLWLPFTTMMQEISNSNGTYGF